MLEHWRAPRTDRLVCLVLLFVGAGCSESGKGTVSGTVTFGGSPLKRGTIRFEPADGKSQPAEAVVTDGQFSVVMPPGEKLVKITAAEVIGKKKAYDTPESPEVDEYGPELIPARYNVNTELKLTVTAGAQEKNFQLTK